MDQNIVIGAPKTRIIIIQETVKIVNRAIGTAASNKIHYKTGRHDNHV